MNSKPVDIVIPWLNPTEKWFSQYRNYCEDENPARIRDLNTIRPTIRSIIKNLPWIRYIWLIVFNEEQIPNDWEELNNEKIKFVFHKDIIPEEFLPNFNSVITSCFAHRIKGLSENFIWSDDDMIFMKLIPEEFFFDNDKPVHRRKDITIWKDLHCNRYAEILNTTAQFIESITGKRYRANDYHMPMPISKNLAYFTFEKYKNEIMSSCENSKIRKNKNIAFLSSIHTLTEVYDYCEYKEFPEIHQGVIHLHDYITKYKIENLLNNNHIVCINDSEELVKTWKEKANWIKELFHRMFPV